MSTSVLKIERFVKVPVKSIALPVEHGAWGFLFEPALAGLILAPSPAAPFILLMIIGAFLTRQPLKFLLGDWSQKRRLSRTKIASQFVLIFGVIAVIGLLGSIFFAPSVSFIPFLITSPIVVFLIIQDVARRTREILPEILAAFTLSSSITVFALADGWDFFPAFALWLIMLARLLPTILYVRSRLRLEKGRKFSVFAPIAAHFSALIAVGAFCLFGLISILTVLMTAFLLARAALGLSRFRQPIKAKSVGIREVIYGIIYALTIVIGFYWSN